MSLSCSFVFGVFCGVCYVNEADEQRRRWEVTLLYVLRMWWEPTRACPFWRKTVTVNHNTSQRYAIITHVVQCQQVTAAQWRAFHWFNLCMTAQSTVWVCVISPQVIQRIFYTVNRSWSGKITCPELRKSNFLEVYVFKIFPPLWNSATHSQGKEFRSLTATFCPNFQNVALLEQIEDTNQLTEFFPYDHFYVICYKFFELDTDSDSFISQWDLARHNNQGTQAYLTVTWRGTPHLC